MNKYVLYPVPFVTHCFVINMFSFFACIIKAAILDFFIVAFRLGIMGQDLKVMNI